MSSMDTSFLPEQSTQPVYQYGARRSPIATIIAILAIVLAILATGAAWYLRTREEANVADIATRLQSTERQFDMGKIGELASLDQRLNTARDMFNKHAMPSLVLDYLAKHTVSSLHWTQFSYTRAGTSGASSGDMLSLSGESLNGYNALVDQLQEFRGPNCAGVVTSVDLQSYHIDPRTNVVSLSMVLTLSPSFATFQTVRNQQLSQAAATVSAAPAPVPTAAAVPNLIPDAQSVPAVAPAPRPAVTAPTTSSLIPPAATAPAPKASIIPQGH